MDRRGSWLLVAALLVAACDSANPVTRAGSRNGRLDRETFIDVYVDLRRAELETGTPEAFQARKQEILARYRTTPEALLEFVEGHARDVRYMAELWDSVDARLSARKPDGAPAPEAHARSRARSAP